MAITAKQIKVMLIVVIVIIFICLIIGWIFKDRLKRLFSHSGSLKTSLDRSESSYSNRSSNTNRNKENDSARPNKIDGGNEEAGFFNQIKNIFKTTPTPSGSENNRQSNAEDNHASVSQPSTLNTENPSSHI